MAWLGVLEARAARWPWPLWALFVTVKWCLVGLGAVMVIGNFVQKWGWSAGLWFSFAPLIYGLWWGLSRRSQD